MSELQWRSEMRKLGEPLTPERDLWPDIAARIAAQRSRRLPSPRLGFAIAASVMIACAAVLVAHRAMQRVSPATVLQQQAFAEDMLPDIQTPRTALDWTTPVNPVLAAAAHDLDSSSADLQQALEQRPDAVFLVGILNRTNAERVRLLQQSPYAG
jgi:hypothetical protein